jgi:inorganic pyrophosphatase
MASRADLAGSGSPADREGERSAGAAPAALDADGRLPVTIEIPRGSFLKRGSDGRLDFVSPLPCPFNYGSVPHLLGLEGDLLDAVVLGPRLARGHRGLFTVHGAIGLRDRGLYDDKLICTNGPLSKAQRRAVLAFFHCYAACKRVLNLARGQPGVGGCTGWCSAEEALARARPLDASTWRGPSIGF